MEGKFLLVCFFMTFVTGCVSIPKESDFTKIEAVKIGDKIYLNKDEVFQYLLAYRAELGESMISVDSSIEKINIRLDALENLSSSRDEIQIYDSSQRAWVCIIKKSSDDRAFMEKDINKSAAVFKVMERCRAAGVSSFYCNEDDVVCSDN